MNVIHFAKVDKEGGGEDAYPQKVDILRFFVCWNPFLKYSTHTIISFATHTTVTITTNTTLFKGGSGGGDGGYRFLLVVMVVVAMELYCG